MGNKFAGRGFESDSNYPNTEIKFCDIPNIFGVKKAFEAIVDLS